MDHFDSKVLESFMIPEDEIATEGLFGGIVLSIVLLPYVLIGGFMVVMGASVANENRKMRKEINKMIKKNKGKAIDYGKHMPNLMREYSKNIQFVEEPKEYAQIVTNFQKLYKYAKQIDSYSENLYKDYKSAYKSAPKEDYFNSINKAIQEFEKSLKYDPKDTVKVSLEQSNMYKLYNMANEIDKIGYGSYWGADNIDNVDDDAYEDVYSLFTKYQVICEDMTEAIDINGLLTDCKFVLKGKLKKTKK